jgi:hypothetical protein
LLAIFTGQVAAAFAAGNAVIARRGADAAHRAARRFCCTRRACRRAHSASFPVGRDRGRPCPIRARRASRSRVHADRAGDQPRARRPRWPLTCRSSPRPAG